MNDFGYVAISFPQSERKYFSGLVKQLCSPDDFYKSDMVDYIDGNVTDNLHLTLFYGLLSEEIDKSKIQKIISLFTMKSIFVTRLLVKPGYQNLYKIIELEIKDKELIMSNFVKTIKKFPHEPSVQLQFEPHMTLAYVQPSFEDREVILNKKIAIKSIKYYSL